MKNVAIFPNVNRDVEGVFTAAIVERLDSAGVAWTIVGEADEIPRAAEMVIALGGDGTILQCATRPDVDGKLVLGINAGNLGFLTGLNGISDADLELFDRIVSGEYEVSERLMLDIEFRNKRYLALNDVYLHAQDNEAIKIAVAVNEKHLKTYHGDGVIVATTSGSTAYSLSAGSIPLNPEIQAILFTPICSINIGLGAFAINSNETIMLETRSNSNILTIDGTKIAEGIGENECVFVKRSERLTRLVHPKNGIDFLSRVREKMCEHIDSGDAR